MDTLRIKTTGLLIKKQLLEQRKFYLLSAVVTFVMICIFNLAFFYFVSHVNTNKYEFFCAMVNNLGFIAATTVITAASFYETHNPRSVITYLQLPAGTLEKTVSNLVICFVLMPLLLMGVLYGTNAIFTTVYNSMHIPRYDMPQLRPGFYFSRIFSTADYVLMLLFLNSIYFAGAARFKKLSWVSTTVTAGIFITVLLCINILPSINNNWVALPSVLVISKWMLNQGLHTDTEQFARSGYYFLLGFRCFLWAAPLLLIAAAYYRLKEKNV